ncbi:MAG: hypothetical protein PHI49_08325 [Halothiobacillaceae bacterium]|nr:hypothetical protein [Halothiobacillaceae bacterium]
MARDPEFWRLGLAYPLLARLPDALAYPLAGRVGVWGPAERAGIANAFLHGARRMLPDRAPAPGSREEAQWRHRHLVLFAHEQLDACHLPALAQGGRKMELPRIEGLDALDSAREEGQGVILVMAHYGRFILLLAQLGLLGYRMSMLTMRIDSANPALSPRRRAFLSNKVAGLLGCIGGAWLSVGDNLRPMLEGLRQGETWIVLMDAYEGPSIGELPSYPFLGGQLHLPSGIPRLANRTGARLVYASVIEEADGTMGGRLVGLSGDAETAFEAAVAELALDVQTAPWAWWPWSLMDRAWHSEAERQPG